MIWWMLQCLVGHKGLLSPLQLARAAPPAVSGSCACLFEARCCVWNTRPVSALTSAKQWGRSSQAQPLLDCSHIHLVAMLGLVAEPLLHVFVAHTESVAWGVCIVHAFRGGRWLRVVLDISLNYPRRIFFFSLYDCCLVDKHPHK